MKARPSYRNLCSRILVTMRYIAALLLALLPWTALAASSDWLETSGAKLRLIARDMGQGQIEAAFQIVLDDGWKTYWKVPGSSGVPPHIVLATDPFGSLLPADSEINIQYPVPVAFSDGAGWAAGYKRDVTFPIDISGAGDLGTLHASGLVGICSDICIPVQFNLKVELDGSAQSNADEQRILTDARAQLPGYGSADIAVAHVERSLNVATVTVPKAADTAFWFDLERGSPVKADRVNEGTAVFTLTPEALSANTALVVAGDDAAIVTLP